MKTAGCRVSIVAVWSLVAGFASIAGAGGTEGRIDLGSLDALRARASEVAEANLDGTVIKRVLENPKLASSLKNVARDLTEVHALSIELGDRGTINLAELDPLRAQLKDSGWTRALSNQEKAELEELYTLKRGEKVVGIVVLAAEARELAVVNLVGAVDPAQLSALDFDSLTELGEAMAEGPAGTKGETKRPALEKKQAK